jgi:hypothetical protein
MNTRQDPGPHFPIHEMRQSALVDIDVPLSEVDFLKEFSDDDTVRQEVWVSEDSLHKGLYRNDWDGVDDSFNPDNVEYNGEGSTT